jgi:signal transduction histidine kinase
MKRILSSLQFRLYSITALIAILATASLAVNFFTATVISSSFNTLDVVGLQRSNAYLLASIAQRVNSTRTETDEASLLALLEDSISNSRIIEDGMDRGNPTLNITQITQPELRGLLTDLDTEWTRYWNQLEAYAGMTQIQRAEQLDAINQQSVIVFTLADRLASGYNTFLDQQVRNRRNLLVVLTGFAGFLIVGLITVVVQTVASIRGLGQVTEQLAQGNLKARAKTNNVNEIASVATVMNTMAGRMEALIDELGDQVNEAETARAEAERSDRVKSAFLASMSHELRTPLNSVINFSKFVSRGVMGPVTDKQKEALGRVIDSGQHLLNLINDVLDISKIESGSLNLFVEDDIDLRQLLDQAVTTAHGLAHPGVTLTADLPADLPTVRGDRKRILQIILNVMSNACKFTTEGIIDLSARVKDDIIAIEVRDTGPGISLEDHAGVFEPFKQTGAGLRQGSGTGLGMPISKNLAEAHGGRLHFESQPGEGTTFHIELPVRSPLLVPAPPTPV